MIHNAGHNEASPLQQSVAVTVLYSLTQKVMSGSPLGLWLPFEIMDFVPGEKWSWRVMNIPATDHRVEALASGQCRLVFEVPWIAAPYLLVCKIAARRIKLIAERS